MAAMRRRLVRPSALAGAAAILAALAAAAAPAPAPAAPAATAPASAAAVTLAPDPVGAGLPGGVSPEVFLDERTGTYWLYSTDRGIQAYTSKDGKAWTAAQGARTPQGADPSVVALADGTYRMYFTASRPSAGGPPQPCAGKSLAYATSSDLLVWQTQPGTLVSDIGCGVPEVVARTGGGFLLTYVSSQGGHGVHVGTSQDGLAWTLLPGLRSPADIVDPSVVALPDGSYLMIAADFPFGKGGGGFQKLYAALSRDGLTWSWATTPFYAPAGKNALDPTVARLPDGTYRVWFAFTVSGSTDPAAGGQFQSVITSGTLGFDGKPAAAAGAAASLPTPGKPRVTARAGKVTVAWTLPRLRGVSSVRLEGRPVGTANWGAIATAKPALSGTFAFPVARFGISKPTAVEFRVVAVAGTATAASAATRATVAP